ncbi:nickel transport system permease protein [Acetoanaerobium pronyense]|uniref:Nickel transport system permease protein n=1 Tax=Acetoanaerobium pronyense TaxID=1482736 RepID=A0ABS4KL55_9FIRM|nr:nickel/cobalt ABC transporter permease [Acetoanaerobium pronyense]MBP2028514.1 nickel transport system permease protein [Acetoanaerobium pronyense]
MRTYVLKRLLATIPMLIIVSLACFLMIQGMNSDPAEVVLRVRQTPIITEQAVEEMRIELGLDKPLFSRYVDWFSKSLRFDFGVSYVNPKRTVVSELKRSLPVTVQLALLSVLVVFITSLILGSLAAYHKNRSIDKIIRIFLFTFSSMPSYWLALMLIGFFSIRLNLLPTGGKSDSLHSLILPVITLSLAQIPIYVRLIRSNMIEVLNEDFIFYARAKGVHPLLLLKRHVLKNSIQSSITALGMSIPQLIAGTLVVENIFSLPGIGRLSIEAILSRDYPVIQAYVWLIGLLFILFNLIFDVIQGLNDPRIRQREA